MRIGYARVSTHEQKLDRLGRGTSPGATLAGLAAARVRGRKGGRPRNLDDDDKEIRQAVTLHGDPTNSVKYICRTLGISKATLYR